MESTSKKLPIPGKFKQGVWHPDPRKLGGFYEPIKKGDLMPLNDQVLAEVVKITKAGVFVVPKEIIEKPEEKSVIITS